MWPTYQIGSPDSLHALGAVSVNFANFERSLTWVFAAVSKLSEDAARSKHARIGTSKCVDEIERLSLERAWVDPPLDLVSHFVAAARLLVANRNLLMHSVVVHAVNDGHTLYRTSWRGDREVLHATVGQIREVADDLYSYFNFALALASCIAVKVDGVDRQAGMIVFPDWPQVQ